MVSRHGLVSAQRVTLAAAVALACAGCSPSLELGSGATSSSTATTSMPSSPAASPSTRSSSPTTTETTPIDSATKLPHAHPATAESSKAVTRPTVKTKEPGKTRDPRVTWAPLEPAVTAQVRNAASLGSAHAPEAQVIGNYVVVPLRYAHAPAREFFYRQGYTPAVDGVGGLSEADLKALKNGESNDAPNPDLSPCDSIPADRQQQCGEVLRKFESLGLAGGDYLWPVDNAPVSRNGQGFTVRLRNGFLTWSPTTGTHVVSPASAMAWKRTGFDVGWLGYPLTDPEPLGRGWQQEFEHGLIVGSNQSHSVVLSGPVLAHWQQLGAEQSELGMPLSDVFVTEDGRAQYAVFEDGLIVHTPETGAHEIAGVMTYAWVASGLEKGDFGYPVGPTVTDAASGHSQEFEGGTLHALSPGIAVGSAAGDAKEVLTISTIMNQWENP